jgi:SlyX protein
MTDAERLIEIETKLSFQDQTIARLQEAVTEQQKQIDRLKVLTQRLQGKQEAGPGDDLSNEPPPPHYR